MSSPDGSASRPSEAGFCAAVVAASRPTAATPSAKGSESAEHAGQLAERSERRSETRMTA